MKQIEAKIPDPQKNLQPKDFEKLFCLEAVMEGKTVSTISKNMGCSRNKVYRLIDDDEFQNNLSKAYSKSVDHITRTLPLIIDDALAALGNAVCSPSNNLSQILAIRIAFSRLDRIESLLQNHNCPVVHEGQELQHYGVKHES